MSRDQRSIDNWALWYAHLAARSLGSELRVAFCLVPSYQGASDRHFRFMLEGLKEVAGDLAALGVPFDLLRGDPTGAVPKYLDEHGAGTLVMDFDPLRSKTSWRSAVVDRAECSCVEVDAHNIVPCWVASPKKEYAAATLRPKLRRILPEFIDAMPGSLHARTDRVEDQIDWATLLKERGNGTGSESLASGQKAALDRLRNFISSRLSGYTERRNDPNADGQSGLSPYLHFGMISAQRVAREVKASTAPEIDKEAFLEELIVRRELSDNFCFYDQKYDAVECLPSWAQLSLRQHESDRREYHYDLEELERGRTHDDLWNAAQGQMVRSGHMHGYLRMYWAKKVLEWSLDVGEAMAKAITLNDRYQLDGRDPNGYAGIAWSVGGLHDRAWPERPVFGKVRYMNYNGARTKFDVDQFVQRWT
jgi:deoxyribodipyrimidine photo-lyase